VNEVLPLPKPKSDSKQVAEDNNTNEKMRSTAKKFQSEVTRELWKYFEYVNEVLPLPKPKSNSKQVAEDNDTNEKMRSTAKKFQLVVNMKLAKYVADANLITYDSAKVLQDQVANDLDTHLDDEIIKQLPFETKKSIAYKALSMQKAIQKKLDKYVNVMTPATRILQKWSTLVSGVLFLLDLLCIVWWYARYIYRVQPSASFWTYFLDFVICSMFALAANSWTKPSIFLLATACASAFLVWRFVRLYYSSDASMTDRQILYRASRTLVVAMVIAVLSLFMADKLSQKLGMSTTTYYLLPGVLSLIGIVLTIWMRRKIAVAVDIYSARHAPITEAYLWWPETEPAKGKEEKRKKPEEQEEEQENEEQQRRGRIRHHTETGLKSFDSLFLQFGKHDRIYSRVHSETELRVQSYILGMPSCGSEVYAEEIEKKAFMVAVSHWLDDLVDGRNEVDIFRRLQKSRKLHNATPLSDEPEKAEKLFEEIYRPLIIKYTDRNFYEALYRMICRSCLFPFNRRYMFLGLNRVAYGAVIFSPRLNPEQRMSILDDHNVFLKDWNVEGVGKFFENKVEAILDKIVGGGEAGSILLALTTKTVQEVALSSENFEMNIGLSILLSILYAPLIYYHNINEELANDEMIPLQSFDTDSDLWIPWLEDTREKINSIWDAKRKSDPNYKREIDRKEMRIKQIEMAYRCFEPKLPKSIRGKLCNIYVPQDKTGSQTKDACD
jgi:hypothetical protein